MDAGSRRNTPIETRIENSLRAVVNDPRRAKLRFCPIEQAYVYDPHRHHPAAQPSAHEEVLGGVTRPLARIFWPDYDYKTSLRMGARLPKAARLPTGLRRGHHGIRRGRAVHEQLSVWINQGRRECQRQCAVFNNTVHPFVPRIVRSMAHPKLQLVPRWGELMIWDRAHALGSAIDVVCSGVRSKGTPHERKGIWLCELKVGGTNYFDRASSRMRGPLAAYNDCPMHQAFVQVTIYKEMLCRLYPRMRPLILGCCVMQATEQDVRTKMVPHDIVSRSSEIYDYFLFQRAR